jgi:hypothetical protein
VICAAEAAAVDAAAASSFHASNSGSCDTAALVISMK